MRDCNLKYSGAAISTYMCSGGGSNIIVDQVPLVRAGLGALPVRAAARARESERHMGVGHDSQGGQKDSSGSEDGLHFLFEAM